MKFLKTEMLSMNNSPSLKPICACDMRYMNHETESFGAGPLIVLIIMLIMIGGAFYLIKQAESAQWELEPINIEAK